MRRPHSPGEVLVATHIDTGHLHNHLVVNSVSCVNGRKLYQDSDDLQQHGKANDEICITHSLSALEPPRKCFRKKQIRLSDGSRSRRTQSTCCSKNAANIKHPGNQYTFPLPVTWKMYHPDRSSMRRF